MKTKLHKRIQDQNLKKIKRVLNALIFNKNPIPEGKYSFQEIILKIQKEFFESTQGDGFFAKVFKKNDQLIRLAVQSNESKEDILRKYLRFFALHCPTGFGFTPYFAVTDKLTKQGYNCFGKAITFASCMVFHDIETELAFSTDHAMCICYDEGKMYLCDPSSGSIWKMNGLCCEHPGYGWYRKVKDDEFRFNYLVTRSVSFGGFYTIMRTFEFLKETPWDHSIVRNEQDVDFHADLLTIMNPNLPYRKLINSIDWTVMIDTLFPHYDNYKKEYRKEWLFEIEFVRRWRLGLETRFSFDRASFHAIRATHFKGTFHDFNRQNILFMKMTPHSVIRFLEQNVEINVSLPKSTLIYLRILRNALENDSDLKEYVIREMRNKLLDTVA